MTLAVACVVAFVAGVIVRSCITIESHPKLYAADRKKVQQQVQAAHNPKPEPLRPLPPEYTIKLEAYQPKRDGYYDGDRGIAIGDPMYHRGLMYYGGEPPRMRYRHQASIVKRKNPGVSLDMRGYGKTVEEAAENVVKKYWKMIDEQAAEAEGIERIKATLETNDDIQEQLDKR